MLIPYVLLLFLYIGLTILYAFKQNKTTPIKPWPQLPTVADIIDPVIPCQTNADCRNTHVCLHGVCLPKFLRGGQCNPSTGRWISHTMQNTTLALCSCLDEKLYSQKIFGGDCNVSVACGVHGQYNPVQRVCECDPGYRAVDLRCEIIPILERPQNGPCGPDEMEVSGPHSFHADYITRLQSVRCVKRPCSFDALNGRFLKHGRFEPDWGCVCDPKYGLFGVRLEGSNKKYLINSEGYDACASIFLQDPPAPLHVELVTFFYLGKRPPISIISFTGLTPEDLNPFFGNNHSIMIRQSLWRYDYAQYFFKNNPTFHARTRNGYRVQLFDMLVLEEFKYLDDFKPDTCERISHMLRQFLKLPRDKAYKLLYNNPICYVSDRDSKADPIFYDRFIVNPQQLTYQDYEELIRYNGFVLKYDTEFQRWTLDLDYPFKVELYQGIDTNVPRYGGNP